MPFTSEFKDKYVAPEISSFTAASIPEMPAISVEQREWLGNFILASGWLATMDGAWRRTLFNFIRHAEAAFRAYAAARQATLAYLAEPNPDAVSGYFVAIGHWEVFLSQAYQAWNVFARGESVLFRRSDASLAQRLNHLYNRTKHIASAVKNDPPQFPPDGTLPVWLRNDGLHSVDCVLSFEDTGEILEGLATWADAAQNPPLMTTKLAAAYGLTVEEFLGESLQASAG